MERFEHELHAHITAVEQDLLREELARYDVAAEQVEVEGVTYQATLTAPETYLTAAGPVTVERHLYRPAGRVSRSICPLELHAGIIAGYWTPRDTRQAAFTMAHLTALDSETLFAELEGMRPSRASLDRLPKVLSGHWEDHRAEWEAALARQDELPAPAQIMAISVDGVTVRIQNGESTIPRDQPGKHSSGPLGQREAGCATVSLYDADGNECTPCVLAACRNMAKKPCASN